MATREQRQARRPQLAAKPGEDIMAEANALVNGDRKADYGPPRESCEGVALIWSGLLRNILKRNITPEEVALMLCGLKLRRECARSKRDNLVDAHGYLLIHAHVAACKDHTGQ